MAFTAIHVAEFPIVAWRHGAPQLHTRACVIVEGVPPQERVLSLCSQAAGMGVEHGMSRVQAEAGAAAVFRARKHGEEHEAFALLLSITKRYTPRTEAVASPMNAYAEAHRPAVLLLLDSTGIGTLFGTVEQYARRLYAELHAAGLPAGVGAAPNAEAALLLARSTEGVVFADRENVRARLARLPVSLLRCEAHMKTVLRRWGIRTLGELAALPESALISRLGQQGRRLQQLARGEAGHLFIPQDCEFVLSETVALDAPVELLESLLFVISPLLENILRKAVEHAYALRSVRLTLQLEPRKSHTIAVRPATPTQSREVLLKLLNLELQAHPPQSSILGLTMTAEPAMPQTAQRGLFQAQFPEPDNLELLLARLRAIAGEENVGSPALQNRHGDDAFTVAPFQPELRPDAGCGPLPFHLALRMLRPPQIVRVICSNDQPSHMFWQGAHLLVSSCAGPWHASGSWWNREAWEHDLWDVVTREPIQMLRLRHDHASKNWSVVGLYD